MPQRVIFRAGSCSFCSFRVLPCDTMGCDAMWCHAPLSAAFSFCFHVSSNQFHEANMTSGTAFYFMTASSLIAWHRSLFSMTQWLKPAWLQKAERGVVHFQYIRDRATVHRHAVYCSSAIVWCWGPLLLGSTQEWKGLGCSSKDWPLDYS